MKSNRHDLQETVTGDKTRFSFTWPLQTLLKADDRSIRVQTSKTQKKTYMPV